MHERNDHDVVASMDASHGRICAEQRTLFSIIAEADRRGLLTIAFVGYDGGRVAREGLADHVVVTESQHIPRIQEAQATAYHALRELIELTAA